MTLRLTVPKVLFKDVLATRTTGAPLSTVSQTPAKVSTKTPARGAKPINNAFKTPSLTTRKPARGLQPQPQQQHPSHLFKTPLNRGQRNGGALSPVPLDFGAFVKPCSLRNDSSQEDLDKVEPPSMLELLEAHLNGIDEEQEVEYAGSSAWDSGTPVKTNVPSIPER